MAKRTWTFWLEGRIHTIELEHGSFSGRRVISVDGRELERSQRLFDTGSEHTFSLDGHDVTVYIHTNGFTFRYGLEIDGMPVKGEGEEIRVTHAATPLAKARDQAAVTVVAHALMVREIRSWGFWLLGLGALHLVLSGFLSAPWGILLGVVGLASFIFHDSAMFVVYGTTLVWAA
ncbi:MAG: hypothetical protein QME94_01470, partial [Anaerolineae bacterium]|nr:hypothetical protein [Anaerolineae bacterium]